MAGQFLAVGCSRAAAMDEADLIVINTCAVREHAEAKVIGRQGLLADMKRARPGTRVVLTGCGVREAERAGLAHRIPGSQPLLRPRGAQNSALRLGPASARRRSACAAPPSCHHDAESAAVGAADRRPPLVRAVAEERVARSSPISAWLPIVYGSDRRAPTASCRFVVARARPTLRRCRRRTIRSPRAVFGADPPRPEREQLRPRSPGRGTLRPRRRAASDRTRLDPDPDRLAELLYALDAVTGRTGASDTAPPLHHFTPSRDLSDRLIETMADVSP